MLATLSAHGDSVLILRSYRRGRGIQVGDVVNFKHPMFPRVGAIKRVGGMPGDFVCQDENVGGRMIQVRGFLCLLKKGELMAVDGFLLMVNIVGVFVVE